MNTSEEASHPVSKGVDELITRLRQEGVDAGVKEADELIAQAQREAKKILQEAENKAQAKLVEAQQKADNLVTGGENALKTAMRDMVLQLKTQLSTNFAQDVKRLIEREMATPDLIKTLILELAGKLRQDTGLADAKNLQVILPQSIVGLQELQAQPEKLDNSELSELVFGLTQEMLREGVSFRTDGSQHGGLALVLEEKELVIDFTDEAVAEMLLAHLQPRFRAFLEGVVR